MVTKYLKKKIAIALVAAMAIGGVTPTQIVPSFKMENVKAAPTATPAPEAVKVSFDYASKMLKIAENVSDSFKPYAIGESVYYQTVPYTGTDFGTPGTLNTSVKKWTAIEIGHAEAPQAGDNSGLYGKYNYVDFSWLSCTKKQDLYVAKDAAAVEAGEETPVKITINAQSSNLKIKYYGTKPANTVAENLYVGNDITGYLVSEAAKTGATPVVITTTQYKTENGEWTTVGADLANELLKYINKGVKLQFRVAPSDVDNNVAGKAITVSVPAKANGPKVTVDYNKQQITFPKDSEYILSADYKVGAEWTEAPLDGRKVKPLYFDDTKIGYDGTEAKTFYVRTVAKQNKACSKITVVTIGAQVIVGDGVVNVANGKALLATKYDATDNTTKEKVFIQYKTPYDKSSGLLITNNSNKAYQVAVVKIDDIKDYYDKTGEGEEVSYDFTAKGSKMIIGENTSKIKFTDVKAYTVDNRTGAVKKEGSATIATRDLFKTEGSKIDDYVILYRQYDKSSKTNTAPAKTYMVPMAATLNQILKVSDGAETDPIEAVGETNIKAKELVGTATKLNLTCSVSPEFNKNSKSVAKVYTESNGTYTEYKKFTVKIANNKKDVTVQANSATADGEYYVGVTLEGATTYYKINYVKAKQLTLGKETVTLTQGTDEPATITLTTAGVADNTDVTTKWVKAANSTETEEVSGITVVPGKITSNGGSVQVTIGTNCKAGTYYLAITVEGVTKVATIKVEAASGGDGE
ncbi:MAG: hypothetical protein II838_01110 [Lachnospiraceae bacterium]|nr:hypothetical protein [Lachnospiraceae bacterium]